MDDSAARRIAELEAEVARLAQALEAQRRDEELLEQRAAGERALEEALTHAKLRLYELAATCTRAELLRRALDEAEALTRSAGGFHHVVEQGSGTIALEACSSRAGGPAGAAPSSISLRLEEAGVFGECVRQQRPLVQGPEAGAGSSALGVPILREGKVVAVFGVCDKPGGYTERDVQALVDLANVAWELAERKRTEEALRRTDAKFRAVLENSNDAILFAGPDAEVHYRSPAYAKINGFSDEERQGRDGLEIIHPDDARWVRDRWLLIKSSPGTTFKTEYRVRHRDGRTLWVESTAQNLLEHPSVGEIVVTTRDITERKLAQQALEASEERYRKLFTAMSIGCAVCRVVRDEAGQPLDATLLDVNEAYLRIVDRPRSEVVGRRLSAYIPPSIFEEWRAHALPVVHSGAPAHWSAELPRVGRAIECHAYATEPESFVLLLTDVTAMRAAAEEKRRLEGQLHHAQKMEAIGTLAGGVAHDFNNILGGLLSGLSVLELELGEEALGHKEDLEDMKALVIRGGELTKQLLGFARRGKYDARPLDLAVAVQKTAQLFGRTRRDVILSLDLAPHLPAVCIDQTQLEQVVLNLLVNASQAMPEGGRITVGARSVTLGVEETEVQGAKPGRYVQLVVSDTGVGMDAATQARIFEPFFTTKAPDRGTGLGLASVYGIVKNHGGLISVESALGAGATFRISFPASEAEAEPAAPSPTPQPGQGTILVVDDEPQLLRLCARMLQTLGYKALTAPGGREAIELVRKHQGELSVVLLDLTMPGMSGAKTFEAIRELAPSLKVLLASGFTAEGQAQELLAKGCNGFIQKPFDSAGLSAALRSLT